MKDTADDVSFTSSAVSFSIMYNFTSAEIPFSRCEIIKERKRV